MDWQDFSDHMNPSLSSTTVPLHIQSVHAISGGDIHQCYHLHTTNKNYFLKLNDSQYSTLLETEKHSLTAMRHSNTVTCPQTFGSGIYNDQAWLLMEFIDLSPARNPTHEKQRGRALAHMHHQINSTPEHDFKPYGWFENNFIGLTPQQNLWHSDWSSFYAQQRLKPQLELALLRNAPTSLYASGMQLIDELEFWFSNYTPEASLLHGDLWGGNSGFDASGEPIFFDPACYYGDRETDLAMTELFGGFSTDFYSGYNELFPLDKGYQQRKPLYNLYHILNHFNLFGGDYAQQAEKVIQHLLKQITPS